jgi:hypothetical protein
MGGDPTRSPVLQPQCEAEIFDAAHIARHLSVGRDHHPLTTHRFAGHHGKPNRSKTMSGFREQLFAAGVEILERHIYNSEAITPPEGHTLRELWECSRVGNLLVQAVEEVAPLAFDNGGIAYILCNAQGFFSKREIWYSQRLRHRVITAWRGADCEEIDPQKGSVGMSWTTDFRVAEFFARRARSGVVLQAQVRAAAWLETAESELLVPEIGTSAPEIVALPSGFVPIKSADWDSLKPIPPSLRGAPHAFP